eukprot:SAG31_NODE_374_length_16577_cov_9.902173_1_plen_110_part_10
MSQSAAAAGFVAMARRGVESTLRQPAAPLAILRRTVDRGVRHASDSRHHQWQRAAVLHVARNDFIISRRGGTAGYPANIGLIKERDEPLLTQNCFWYLNNMKCLIQYNAF